MITRLKAPCYVLIPDSAGWHFVSLDSAARALSSRMEEACDHGDPDAIASAEHAVIEQNRQTCGVLTCDWCGDEYDDGEHLADADDEAAEIAAAVADGWTRGPGDKIHCSYCPALTGDESREPGPQDVPLPTLAPPMPQEELVQTIKAGLTDPVAWAGAIATPELVKRTRDWLVRTKMEVDQDLSVKRTQLQDDTATLDKDSPERRAIEQQYHRWRKSALNFRRLLERRYSEVAAIVARQTAERRDINDEATRLGQALLSLAEAVDAAVAGRISLGELSGCLDRIAVPDGPSGNLTVREVLARRSDKTLKVAM